MVQAVRGLTVLLQASWKDLERVSWQILPMEEKVYAAARPNSVQMIAEGMSALGSLENAETPLREHTYKMSQSKLSTRTGEEERACSCR
jgi:hypothetical protein